MRWLDGIIDSTDMSLSKLWKTAENREGWCAAVHLGKDRDMTEQQGLRRVQGGREAAPAAKGKRRNPHHGTFRVLTVPTHTRLGCRVNFTSCRGTPSKGHAGAF